MLIFDLDGVIRSLTIGAIGREPASWGEKINGKDIFEIVDSNKEILVNSPVTEYHKIISQLPEVNIISCQPKDWWDYTYRWLDKNLPQHQSVFVEEPEDKFLFLNDEDILVEDNPNLKNYSQIILIDRPYNQDVKGYITRVKIPEDMGKVIKKYF